MADQLTDEQKEELLSSIKADIGLADRYFEEELEPVLIERNRVYNGDKDYYKEKYPDLSEVSDLVTTDLADIIEWSMPGLMKSYFSGSDIVSIKGVGPEDDKAAHVMQELINYQLTKQNKFFVVCYDWVKQAFIENASAIKVSWERETQPAASSIEIVGAEQFKMMKQTKLIKIKKAEPLPDAPDLFKVEYVVMRLTKNHPKVENVSASELRFSPDSDDLDDCNFVAHRKVVTVDYLRKREKEGLYSNIDDVVDGLGQVKYTNSELLNNPDLNIEQNDDQTARRNVELYECYVKYDADGDQMLEDWIITVANSVIIRAEPNTYGRHPFFLLCPVRDPNKIWPVKGIGQFVSEIQGLKTAFLRQIINNTALNNDLPVFVDENAVNILDIIERKKTIRCKTSPGQAMAFPPLQPMAPWTMNFLEYLENAKEQATGVTRYNQGMDANSLNKTATGISLIHESSNQRLELVARIMLETGLLPFFRFLVELNQKFIDQPQVIRLENQPLKISPDDLRGNFDLEINAALGVGSKQTDMQNIQMLLQMYPQMVQAGVATPQNIYNALAKMLQVMGYKNVNEFISPPQPPQPEQQTPKLSESLSISFKDLPVAAQIQILQQNGIQVSSNDYLREALIRKQIDMGGGAMVGQGQAGAMQGANGPAGASGGNAGVLPGNIPGTPGGSIPPNGGQY